MLVDHLLHLQPEWWDEVHGWLENEDGYRPEIFQWLAFPDIGSSGYDDLIAAGVPVLDTDLGTWVGITSFGSPYELYVYPQLIEAVYGIECDADELHALR